MLYKNKKGIVHNLNPQDPNTIRWVENKQLKPLTEEERKAHLAETAVKAVEAEAAAEEVVEDLPPMPSREEMETEHMMLFDRAAVANQKDENLWKKILGKRAESAEVDPNATQGQ